MRPGQRASRHPPRALQEQGIRSKKSLGQNFLVDPGIALKIVEAAELFPQDTVLEVGAGPGMLTTHLARQASRVIAVEVDAEMLAPLHASLEGLYNVQVVHGDILEQDVAALVGGRAYKVVSNLPYCITSAVLRYLLETSPRPQLLVVTVQKEVAERMVAHPGQMSLLAVSVQFYGVPRIVARIPPGAFRPIPKVHSAVVRVDCFDRLPWGGVDERGFFRVVRAGFGQRRKQLRNALANGLGISVERATQALSAAGIESQRRAETLSIEEWVTLSNAIAIKEA